MLRKRARDQHISTLCRTAALAAMAHWNKTNPIKSTTRHKKAA
nr:MAG TPA: hypothetical protein [Caudoviricetes sp.]